MLSKNIFALPSPVPLLYKPDWMNFGKNAFESNLETSLFISSVLKKNEIETRQISNQKWLLVAAFYCVNYRNSLLDKFVSFKLALDITGSIKIEFSPSKIVFIG